MDRRRLYFLRTNMAYLMGRPRACAPKTRYTEKNAMKMVYQMNTENWYGHKMSPYLCPFCGKWHIGRDFDEKLYKYKKVLKIEDFDTLYEVCEK